MIRPADVAELVKAALRHSATLEPDDAYLIVRVAKVEVAKVEEAIAERLGLPAFREDWQDAIR